MRISTVFAGLALSAAVSAGSAASAAIIYSENFNDIAFVGSNLGLVGSEATSDRWADTSYYTINNANGWTFSGSAYLAKQDSTGDGALLLNETTGVGTTLYGLTVGKAYTLNLLLSGDNRPGQNYVFNVAIAGVNQSVSGTDLAAGTNPGTLLSYNFVATASQQTLTLSQASGSQASPIVDNVSITAVPEPATWALMISGFGLAGAALRRRRTALFA